MIVLYISIKNSKKAQLMRYFFDYHINIITQSHLLTGDINV
jgi:hypothetical protein